MSRRSIDGAELEVLEAGNGEPVVLVHGSASDHRTWEAQLDALARRHRVVSYSRRFHWPNEALPDGADYLMGRHVDDLEALLRAVDARPAHLVGHSYGGFVSLLLAIRRPDLVRSLVLAEPPVLTLFVSDPPKPLELLGLLARAPRTAAAIVGFGARGFAPARAAAEAGELEEAGEIFGRAVLGEEAYDRLSEERLEQARVNTFEAEFLGSGFPPLSEEDVRRVEAPALLVSGAESPAFFHRMIDGLARLLPDHERAVITGASHIVHEDDPPAFNARVLDFLERLDHGRRWT